MNLFFFSEKKSVLVCRFSVISAKICSHSTEHHLLPQTILDVKRRRKRVCSLAETEQILQEMEDENVGLPERFIEFDPSSTRPGFKIWEKWTPSAPHIRK